MNPSPPLLWAMVALAWVWVAGAMALYLWQFLPMVEAIRGSLPF